MTHEKDPCHLEIPPSPQAWQRLEAKLDRYAWQRRRRRLYSRALPAAAAAVLLLVMGLHHLQAPDRDRYAFLFQSPAVLEDLPPTEGCAPVCLSLEALRKHADRYRVSGRK